MSIVDIDRAYLDAAKNRPVINAKFIANAWNTVSPYVVPALGIAATFATGGAAAPLLWAAKAASMASGIAHMVSPGSQQQQGGGGIGGALQGALGQYGGLGGLVNSGINGALSAAAANGNQKMANSLQDHAYDRQGQATKDSLANLQAIFSKFSSPALSGQFQPTFAPTNIAPLRSAQVSNVGGYSVPGSGGNGFASPQTGYDGPPAPSSTPFGSYGASVNTPTQQGGGMQDKMQRIIGALRGNVVTPPAGPPVVGGGGEQTPHAPSNFQTPTVPTGHVRNVTPFNAYARMRREQQNDSGDTSPFGYYGDPVMKEMA